jgi:predicted nucleotidyltransferase
MQKLATKPMIGVNKRIPMRDIHALAQQIAEKFDPERIILFGSYAYGKPKPWSDVDLLVVMDTTISNRNQAVAIARALQYRFGLDLIVRSPEQIEQRLAMGDFFIAEILHKGKVLYARDHTRVG